MERKRHTLKVLDLVRQIQAVVNELEVMYPERRFTLDGHLIGSVGEVIASEYYGLELMPTGARCHDATCPDGRNVQIKLTQKNRVAINHEPDHLLVLKLTESGEIEEVYNGPGRPAWNAAGKMQRNGQRPIALNRLRTLDNQIGVHARIRRLQ
jgi:hypothetical protein